MKKKYGLVLEGGALRGLFTSGVLDYFMEQSLIFPYVVGVSAGACNAISYISGQHDRTRRSMTHEGQETYYGKSALKKCGKIINLDLLFNEYPYEQYPFDFASYFSSGIQREFVVTNLLTGKAEFRTDRNEERRLMNVVKASSSMPIISNPVYIEGVPYLDGSVSEPIPVKRAFLKGCQKCVVILTKPEGYVAKQPFNVNTATGIIYRKYPEFLETYNKRKQVYASRMKLLSYLEKAGMVYVIRPTIPEIGRFEKNSEKLKQYYAHGYETAEQKFEDILHFLGEDKVIYND